MPTRDRIVIGASAGGVEALTALIQELPGDLPAALLVVVHFPTFAVSTLPSILARAGQLPAGHPQDGEPVQSGRIYVAPPNYHMGSHDGVVRLNHGPREHGFRPAIDPLFHSAARAFGNRTVGVLLSGTLSDGVAGLQAIGTAGGVTIVQDPKEALFANLPLNAIGQVSVDYVLPVKKIAAELIRLIHEPLPEEGGPAMPDLNEAEEAYVLNDMDRYVNGKSLNTRTVLTCPECGGVIWELDEGGLARFRCHVGHAYSGESLLVEQANSLEAALWVAVRALEERAALLERMCTRAEESGGRMSARRFKEQAGEAERQADVVRQVLLNGRSYGLDLSSQDIENAATADDPDPQ